MSATTPPAATFPSARSILTRLVLLAVLLGVAVLLVDGLVPGAGHKLANASPGWLVLAVALELLACLSYGLLFHAVFARRPHRIGAIRSGEIAVGELAGFAVVPTGLGGPALRFWALHRFGMPFRTIGVRSVAHAPVFNAPYVLTALLLGLGALLAMGPGHAPTGLALAPIGVIVLTVALALGLVALSRSRWLEPRTVWRDRLRAVVSVVPDGLRDGLAVARRPAAVAGAFGFWAGDCAVLLVAFHASGGSAPVGVVALAYMLGQLGNFSPLPGGVGGVEPAMLAVLTASGVGAGLGAAAILLYRAIALGLQGVLGAVAVAALTRSPAAAASSGKERDLGDPGLRLP